MTEPHWDGEAPVGDRTLATEGASTSIQASAQLLGLSHSDIRTHLSDYAEGNLSDSILRSIREHLDGCPSCRAFLATLLQTVDLLEALPHSKAPSSAKQRVLEQVRSGIVQ